MKDVLHFLDDDTIRKTENYSLIDDPSLEGMPKELAAEFLYLWWEIMFAAFLAVPLRANIFCYCLPTSGFREPQVDNEFFSYLLRDLKRFTDMLWTGSMRRHCNNSISLEGTILRYA